MSARFSVLEWFRSLLQPPPEVQPPSLLHPRVLLIVFDPPVSSEGGRKLTSILDWHNVDSLCQEYIADLKECSDGFVEYEIVQRIDVDGWPVKEDGFRYDGDTYLRNWRSRSGWHQPDWADYEVLLAEFDFLKRIDLPEIDEIWMFAGPYAGFYESRMVGPGAFWCNAPAMQRTDVSRRFVIMGFNYERGVGPMLESFGHRVESHMERVWRHWQGEDNLWKRFIQYDQVAPGQANCGNVHFAPNSVKDYDWGNPTKVLSNCDDWLNFPDLQGQARQVDAGEWGGGDIRAHHKWWLQHLPRATGRTQGISNNWWWYTVDPNAVR